MQTPSKCEYEHASTPIASCKFSGCKSSQQQRSPKIRIRKLPQARGVIWESSEVLMLEIFMSCAIPRDLMDGNLQSQHRLRYLARLSCANTAHTSLQQIIAGKAESENPCIWDRACTLQGACPPVRTFLTVKDYMTLQRAYGPSIYHKEISTGYVIRPQFEG